MINTPETIKGITFYRDLIQKYYVSPSVAAGPQIPLFPTGKTMAMHRDGSWNLTLYQTGIKDFQWDVVQLPIGPIGKRTGYGGSNQFSTWKGIKNPDAGWELLKWLTSAEMTLKYWSTHGVPSVKTAAQSPDFPKYAKLTPKMAQDSALAGTYMQPETTTIRRDEWGTALTDALGPVFEGKISPEAGAKIAQDKIQAIMARPS